MWWLGLVACAEPDSTLHRRALTEAPALPEAIGLCQQIRDPALAGPCVVGVMDRFDSTDPALCAALPAGDLWRDECFFLSTRDGEASLNERLARCDEAGRYRDFCGMHQWSNEVQVLARQVQDPAELARRAQEVLESQRARNTWDSQYSERLWMTVWGTWSEAQAELSLGVCAQVDPAQREACALGVQGTARRLLWQVAEQDPTRLRAACTRLPEGLAGLRPGRSGPRLAQDPVLLADGAAYVAPFCAGRPLGPEPGKLQLGQ